MPTLSDWNWYVLMLGQALLGVISSNFRMVTLKFSKGCWIVEARLASENQIDTDEFNDAIDEFSIFIEDIKHHLSRDSHQQIVGRIVVDSQLSEATIADNARVVFKMRET